MSQFALSCSGVSKSYSDGDRRVLVLDRLDFDLAQGEMVAIVGASGSGKSTLLNLLGGLDRPDEGRIELRGREWQCMSYAAQCRYRNQQLGFVYQFHHLLQDFSALENVALPARIGGLSVAKSSELAKEQLERLGLCERAHHRPSQLSGGERQRVAIARALVMGPSVVLMDEPTGNLDSDSAQLVMRAITQQRSSATAFVLVTHDAQIAAQADRQCLLRQGRLVELAC